MSSLIRVGAVSYLNAKPLYYRLCDFAPNIRLTMEVPSRLAERLAAGTLEVALIPSIEYFRGVTATRSWRGFRSRRGARSGASSCSAEFLSTESTGWRWMKDRVRARHFPWSGWMPATVFVPDGSNHCRWECPCSRARPTRCS